MSAFAEASDFELPEFPEDTLTRLNADTQVRKVTVEIMNSIAL